MSRSTRLLTLKYKKVKKLKGKDFFETHYFKHEQHVVVLVILFFINKDLFYSKGVTKVIMNHITYEKLCMVLIKIKVGVTVSEKAIMVLVNALLVN